MILLNETNNSFESTNPDKKNYKRINKIKKKSKISNRG